MSLRTRLQARIPHLAPVTTVTDDQVRANTNRGTLHRFFVACDVAWGVFGGPEPCTTISSRCAVTLMDAQLWSATDGLVSWNPTTAMWALLLGAFLESIDQGHLQAAMIADVSRQVGGAYYLTGVRVLKPEGK